MSGCCCGQTKRSRRGKRLAEKAPNPFARIDVSMKIASLICSAAAMAVPSPAVAGELFGGLYVHDVDTPLTKSGIEGGADIQFGWRGAKIGRTPLQPYIFGALN